MEKTITRSRLCEMMSRAPDAEASIRGSAGYPEINGSVLFWQTDRGVVVAAEVRGLPHLMRSLCDHPVFAMHIHEGRSCTGSREDPFADTGGHYNPENCTHPYHAGDLPPLFANGGEALMAVLTDRFTVSSVLGRTVIIHRYADDFTTQPAGAAGAKIACGVIRDLRIL